jgi:hypothetical protein
MSRTFLQLCQDIVADLGIAGGTLQSVSGSLNREQQNICNWVARSDLYIQNLWSDWNFLYYLDNAVTCNAGSDQLVTSPPAWAANIQSYDLESLWISAGSLVAQRIPWMDWNDFYVRYQVRQKNTQTTPNFFSVDPNGQIWLSEIAAQNTTFTMQYWCVGIRMVNNGDMSRIPTNFDTIINERAKIIYATRENAPEILSGASAEVSDQLDKMQAYCLPSNVAGRKSRNNRTTVIPSYVE